MNYIDSGNRHPSQAFGTWLERVLAEDVAEVRWQTGFFSADSLGVLEAALARLAGSNSPVKALIGSNDQGTSRAHVEELVGAIRIPREEACVGVIAFQNSFFHPKTFHVRRSDGTQAGYVGSANLTGAGVSSLHVETAVTIDSRDGDPSALLDTMALAVDSWFDEERAGFYRVANLDDVKNLTERGILCEAPVVTRPPRSAPTRPGTPHLARLQPLFPLPRRGARIVEPVVLAPSIEAIRGIILPSTPRAGFPQYLLFAPGASTPTSGVLALSGSGLPTGVAGLIIKLNRDSARRFSGGLGTANVSIPVATLGTFRFGMFPGKFLRPRVEFRIHFRYLANDRVIGPVESKTSIMPYGFIAGEKGHGDVRMVVPAECRKLIGDIRIAGGHLPAPDDVAFLEWPTSMNGAAMRLTFLDRASSLHEQASGLLTNAISTGGSLGQGACWLPDGLAPAWE
jgi:hypothetical protein